MSDDRGSNSDEPDEQTDSEPDSDGDSQGSGGSQGSEDKNLLEWGVTIAGAVVVLCVVGFFVYETVGGSSGPADLRVTTGAPQTATDVASIPIEIENMGARVAEAAVVEVCSGPSACAQITFDYVPYKSKMTGMVGLEAPLQAPLSTRIVSYRDP